MAEGLNALGVISFLFVKGLEYFLSFYYSTSTLLIILTNDLQAKVFPHSRWWGFIQG